MNFVELSLENQAWHTIWADAKQSYPHECCGFLFGHESNTQRTITLAQPVDNRNEQNPQRRFEIAPLDYLRAEQFALSNQISLLGVYHSHPDHPAIPSETDLHFAQPYFSYLIVSVQAGQIHHSRSWQLDAKGQFAEEPLQPST
jgi:proteasome lid subunit RPN8/RPN11